MQFSVLCGLCKGLQGYLVCGGGKVSVNGGNLVNVNVQGSGCGLVEAYELAAHEVIGHLVLEGLHGCKGVRGLVTKREYVRGAGFLPGLVVCTCGVECLNVVCGDAGDSATVRGAGNARNGFYEFCRCLVSRRCRGDDAVSVELGVGKDLGVVGGVFH